MRVLRAQSGEPLFKAIHVTVFHPGNKRPARQVHRAPHGQGISAKGIDIILAQTADKIEKAWPAEEYSLVTVGPTSFNFVWRKKKLEEEN